MANMVELTLAEPAAPADLPVIVEQARAVVVQDAGGAQAASSFLQRIKVLKAEVETAFGMPKAAAHSAHKAVVDAEKKYLGPLVEAEKIVKTALVLYTVRCDAERAEAARNAFLAQEAARASAIKAEEERRAAEASKLAAEGDLEGALARADAPVVAPPVRAIVVAPPPPPPVGISYRETWRAEVVDMVALLEFVVRTGRLDLIAPDQKALDAAARAAKSEGAAMPGVKFLREKTVATR